MKNKSSKKKIRTLEEIKDSLPTVKLSNERREELHKQTIASNGQYSAYQYENDEDVIFYSKVSLYSKGNKQVEKIFRAYHEYRDKQLEDLTKDFLSLISLAKKWRNRGGGKKNTGLEKDVIEIENFIKNLGKNEKPTFNTFKRKSGIKGLSMGKSKFHELMTLIKSKSKESFR